MIFKKPPVSQERHTPRRHPVSFLLKSPRRCQPRSCDWTLRTLKLRCSAAVLRFLWVVNLAIPVIVWQHTQHIICTKFPLMQDLIRPRPYFREILEKKRPCWWQHCRKALKVPATTPVVTSSPLEGAQTLPFRRLPVNQKSDSCQFPEHNSLEFKLQNLHLELPPDTQKSRTPSHFWRIMSRTLSTSLPAPQTVWNHVKGHLKNVSVNLSSKKYEPDDHTIYGQLTFP